MLAQNGFRLIRSHAQGRYLRLGYFATRIEPYNKTLYRALDALIARLNLGSVAIPVNFGDLFTLYARKV
jgi:hypothetical protein